MGKFIVIDGSAILVTNYYANLPKELLWEKDKDKQEELYSKILHNKNGQYTNAIYGTMRFLLKLIKEQNPEYMAIVFDKSRNTFRRKLYPEYKAQRSETPTPLKQQFILIEQILSDIGITVLYDDNYEADDLAGSILHQFENCNNIQTYFITKDVDYMQLINERTRGWMYLANKKVQELREKYYGLWIAPKECPLPDRIFEFTESTCEAEYGVKPYQIPDLKGLAGDKSDNIPGVAGVGEASVIPLLNEYGTIEAIYEEIESVSGDKEAEAKLNAFWKECLGISRSPLNKLKENKDIALLSKQLATIKADCEIDKELENYRVDINKIKMQEVLEDLEFNSLKDFVSKF
jgi:DNA polymerase I